MHNSSLENILKHMHLQLLLSGQDEKKLQDALLFANVCGALTVMKKGAIPALPTKEAVLEFIEKDASKWCEEAETLFLI